MKGSIAVLALACVLTGLVRPAPAQVQKNEEVVFFPTFSWYDTMPERERCEFEIHGWIFEPEKDSLKRRGLLAVLRKALGLEEGEAATELFEKRARAFLVDADRGKTLTVRFGDRTHVLPGLSDETGHVRSRVKTWAGDEGRLTGEKQLTPGWIRFSAALGEGDARAFEGEVQFFGAGATSVISDVDDTLKVSNVRDKKALVRNTFLKEYEPVAGMPELYQALAEKGAAFHYVSASPWPLYPALREFLDAKKFPLGSFHLRDFALTHSEFFNLFESPDTWKPAQIEPILDRLSARRFILIGDSGEKDPEVYGGLARKHPKQIAGVLIRDVTGEPADGERYQNAFEGVPKETWSVFKEPAEIRAKALGWVK